MWKCFNRGVWETVDRSVNLFKADTSNGTCLISSLAKDLDAKNEELLKTNSQKCSEVKSAVCHPSKERNVKGSNESKDQNHSVNRTLKTPCDHGGASNIMSRNLRHLKTLAATQIFHTSPTPSISNDVNSNRHTCRHKHPNVINPCTGRTIHGKCEVKCSSERRPTTDTEYISASPLVDEDRFLYPSESRESNIKWKLHSQSQSKFTGSVSYPEKITELQLLSSKQLEACLPKSDACPLFTRVTLLCDDKDVNKEKVVSPKAKYQPHDLIHSNTDTKSNCLLKLPFLCFDLGRLTGLKSVSSYWLIKPKSEFGKGDSGGSNGEQSEESKEDAWRECQLHQSLFEAIGWSSAILLGWFLGQFRFWHSHGDLVRDDNLENKRKCCIAESLTKFLVTWKCDTILPLKVLPRKGDVITKDLRKKKVNALQGNGTPSLSEAYTKFHPLLINENEGNNISDGHSLSDNFILPKAEKTIYHKNHFKQKLSAVNEAQENNIIPMPWHIDTTKNLAYGPITLEEAIKEAGKGLEGAHAEVLLTLALEKLYEDCSLAKNEPLAADLLQSAASLGSTAAAFNLGICYEKGVGGVVQNLVQAYHWYKQASEKGHAAATYNLAVFHANGLGGLLPNTVLANQLLLKASSMGLKEATNALSSISSLNSSEILHCNEEKLFLNNNISLDRSNIEISNSLKHNMPKSSSSDEGKMTQGPVNMYSELYNGNSTDQSMSLMNNGVVSQAAEFFKEISKMSSSKTGHLFLSSGLTFNNSIDPNRPLLEEMMFDDNHCVKNRCTDNNSVQLLAH